MKSTQIRKRRKKFKMYRKEVKRIIAQPIKENEKSLSNLLFVIQNDMSGDVGDAITNIARLGFKQNIPPDQIVRKILNNASRRLNPQLAYRLNK